MLALFTLLACSDYQFEKGADAAYDGDTGAPPVDTAGAPPPTDSGAPPIDTGGAPPPDTGTPDACYEPENGYTMNPAARLVSTSGADEVTVTFVSSSTAYQDNLRLDDPESILLAQAWSDAPGTQIGLGPYHPEVELMFGIVVLDTGDHFYSGPGTRNADGVVHVAVTYEGNCSWLIGFEDLYGGGDLDYNDVVLRVQGDLRQD